MTEYPGRYTHKVAISNRRIRSVESGTATFDYEDCRKNGRKGVTSLCRMRSLSAVSPFISCLTPLYAYGITAY